MMIYYYESKNSRCVSQLVNYLIEHDVSLNWLMVLDGQNENTLSNLYCMWSLVDLRVLLL